MIKLDDIKRRIAKNVVWTIVSEAIIKGSIFVSNIYLARKLGVENFGVFVFSQSIVLYIWVFADFGISIFGIKEISKTKENVNLVINILLTIKIFFGGIVCFSVISIVLVFYDGNETIKYAVIGASLYLFTSSLYPDWILKGLEKYEIVSFGSIMYSLIFLISILLVIDKPKDILYAPLIWSLSYVGAIFVLHIIIKKIGITYRPNFNLLAWKGALSETGFTTLAGVLSASYQYLPILFIGHFLGQYMLGIFSVAYRIINLVSAVGFYIASGFYPVLSELYNHSDKKRFFDTARILFYVLLVGGIVSTLMGQIFGKSIVDYLFGKEYAASGEVLLWLLYLLPIYYVRYACSIELRSTNYQKYQYLPFIVSIVVMVSSVMVFWGMNSISVLNFVIIMILSELSLVLMFFYIKNKTYSVSI